MRVDSTAYICFSCHDARTIYSCVLELGAIKIQSRARGVLGRKRVQRQHKAATSIQKHARRYRAKNCAMLRKEKENGLKKVEAATPRISVARSRGKPKIRSTDFLRRRLSKVKSNGRRSTVVGGKQQKVRPASAKRRRRNSARAPKPRK